MGKHGRMIEAFVRKPTRVGAVAPSSRRLAERMAAGMELESAATVIELGAGTGVFTRLIAERVREGTLVLAFEIDARLAAALDGCIPGVRVVNDSAERVQDHLRAAGRDGADAILSGLPWANFSRVKQETLLAAVHGALRPGARFSTFAYIPAAWLPTGRRFRALLQARFATVEASRIVWQNLPPAFVYRCTR